MKILAVLLSPLAGAFILMLPLLIWSVFTLKDFIEIVKFISSLIAFIYIFAIIIQVFVVEIIMMSADFLLSFKGYCWLAFILSFLLAIPISRLLENNLERVFLVLLIYSIGNAITYNYLYFSKLNEETTCPVIPTQEGTELEIDEI